MTKDSASKAQIITSTVRILSWVSLFTDMASEMLYPVMPAYLRSIGFGMAAIGLLEGVAEMVAGLGKAWFGAWSDHIGKRLPFIRWGYGLSALSKPMLALSAAVPWVFGARTVDRIGKGLRTGARDALLNEEAGPDDKATVFGYHRSMDTVGAVIGPLLALLFLSRYPGQYRILFWIAFLPGIAAIALTFLVRAKPMIARPERRPFGLLQATRYWGTAPSSYRRLVAPLLVFALVNSSDLLLLLRAREAGLGDATVIGVYVFYNIIYALLAYPVGKLADRSGIKRMLVIGLAAFAVTYAGFAIAGPRPLYLLLFVVYGFYAAATEGVAKAWIGKLVPREQGAAAMGTFAGFQSIAALVASVWAGAVWQYAGAGWAFGISAFVAGLVAVWIMNRGSGIPDHQPESLGS